MKETTNNRFEEMYKTFLYHAKLGNKDALCDLGVMHHNGDHVKQSYKKSVKYFIKAKKLGSLSGKYYLAIAMGVGKGIEQNVNLAMQYMYELRGDGYAPARHFLENSQ